MTVPADYVHIYMHMCIPRKHPQTHIKPHVFHFALNISVHDTKKFTVHKKSQRISQEDSSLTCRKRCYCCQVRVSEVERTDTVVNYVEQFGRKKTT